jgi:LysR family transcriptional regulator, nod-box dependent transcriptional activator
MSLRAVNLNLLPVLQALLSERNLTRAASQLGLTQPALSMALNKLRQVLDDPLLVREGRQMVLTVRARELIPAVEDICTRLEGVFAVNDFDPMAEHGKLVIASSDYGFHILAGKLTAALKSAAPNVVLHTGEVDFFILPRQLFDGGRFSNMRFAPFLSDRFVAIASPETARRYRDGKMPDRFAVYYPGLVSMESAAVSILSGWNGTTGHVAVHLQHFSLLPTLALEGGCVGVLPSQMAQYLCSINPLEIIEGLGTIEEKSEVVLAWYAGQSAQPRNRWFRSLILGFDLG